MNAGEATMYILDASRRICLPRRLWDRVGELIDVTAIGDAWRRFYDPQTGETHDGEVYVAEVRRKAAVDPGRLL